jgi:hypothetical protein
MENFRAELRLIWADKIVIALAVAIAGIAVLAWGLVAIAAGIAGANHVILSFGSGMAGGITVGLLVLWLLLRGLDWAAGGSTARLFARPHTPRPHPEAMSVGRHIVVH